MNIDWEYFIKGLDLLPESVIATVGCYMAVLVYTRVFGLKSFSKMTGFDFLTTLTIGGLLAMTISTAKPAPILGALTIGLLYLLNYMLTILRYKSGTIAQAIDNSPILLMCDGIVLYENLKKTKITEDELRGKLREANALRLSEVKAVILETTGDVSVLHTSQDITVDDYMLEGVRT